MRNDLNLFIKMLGERWLVVALATLLLCAVTLGVAVHLWQTVKKDIQPIMAHLTKAEAARMDINSIVWDRRAPGKARKYHVISTMLALISILSASFYAIIYGPLLAGALGIIGAFIVIFRLVQNWIVFRSHK